MYSKRSLVLIAGVALLAGAPVALAGNDGPRDRDSGLSVHQTELDQQYARSHPTIVPGTPPRLSTPYAYVPPHRPAAKHRHGVHR